MPQYKVTPAPYNPPALPTPTVLFATNFAGTTTFVPFDSAPIDVDSVAQIRADITGTDDTTGQVWPGYSPNHPNPGPNAGPLEIVRSFFDYSIEWNVDALVTDANVDDYIECSFANDTGPSGGTEKVATINLKNTRNSNINVGAYGTPQPYGGGCVLRMQRMFLNTTPVPSNIENWYQKMYIYLQSDLGTLLPNTGVIHTLTEQKAGGENGTSPNGDFRIRVGIQRSGSNLYLMSDVDQNANGNYIYTPTGTLFDSSTGGCRFWLLYDRNHPVTVATWHKLEIYYHRNPTRGFYAIALDDTLINSVVNRTIGIYNNPQGRLSFCSMYTGTPQGTGNTKFAQFLVQDYPGEDSVLYAAVQKYFYQYPDGLL